ncbi:MAG TPA: DUF3617 family protein [Caulobacteraceae bacterium]|jgi:hypothetical protein
MRTILVISCAALALGACQKTPGAATASGPAPAAGPATASASGMPQRRSGLWQQTISREGGQDAMAAMNAMGGMKMCVDASSEAKNAVLSKSMNAARSATSHCGAPTVSRGLDGSFAFSSTCAMGDAGTITSKGTASGDFANAYHIHFETEISGSRFASTNGHHVTDIDGKWLGPCPAGMAAGDIELANGMKINAGRFAGAAKAMGGGQ